MLYGRRLQQLAPAPLRLPAHAALCPAARLPCFAAQLACPCSLKHAASLPLPHEQASASFALHESESCAALLPCGLLPEELEELESLQLEADMLKSAAAPGRAPHRVLGGWLQGAGEAVCSREEAGPRAHSRGAVHSYLLTAPHPPALPCPPAQRQPR